MRVFRSFVCIGSAIVLLVGCGNEKEAAPADAADSAAIRAEERPIDTAALSKIAETNDTIASPDEGPTSEITIKDSVVLEMAGQDGKTVFQVLAANRTVRTKSTSMGDYIYGIGPVVAENGYGWIYTLNDSMPKAAADRVYTKNGDVIKWHFRKQ